MAGNADWTVVRKIAHHQHRRHCKIGRLPVQHGSLHRIDGYIVCHANKIKKPTSRANSATASVSANPNMPIGNTF